MAGQGTELNLVCHAGGCQLSYQARWAWPEMGGGLKHGSDFHDPETWAENALSTCKDC